MDEGHSAWLYSSVAERLPEIADRQGWEVNYRINKQSLTFGADSWPVLLGDCQLRLGTWKKDAIHLTFKVRKDAAPGIKEFLQARTEAWRGAFPAEFSVPPYTTVYAFLSYRLPAPKVGDAEALADVLDRIEKMAGAMVPLLDDYFEAQQPTQLGARGQRQ